MGTAAWSDTGGVRALGVSDVNGAYRLEPQVERPGTVAVETGPERLRIRLSGAVDAVMARHLDGVVGQVAAAQPADVRLDLGEVDFLGSHGMAFLVRVQHAVRAADRSAVIDAVSRQARIALRVAGLEHYLHVPG